MSTRYVRKEVPLEVRGISRASVEHHPLPERVDGSSVDSPTLPLTFVHSMNNAIESYDAAVKRRQRGRLFVGGGAGRRSLGSPTNSSSTPSSNESSSADGGSTLSAGGVLSTTGSAAVDWLARCRGGGIGWTTENTTDRTSVSSSDWGDDVCEFDRQESRRVRLMFEQIESMLFEASNAGPAHLYRECRHWNSRFPHLRLLGLQLLAPQDLGFSHHVTPLVLGPAGEVTAKEHAKTASATPPEVPSPRHPFSATPDADSMALVGRHLVPLPPPSARLPCKEGEEEARSDFEEEIIAQDGFYEEVIAVDNKVTEEDMTEKKYLKRRRHHGYPPLTPNAVLKDTIVSAVFDSVWADIVSWMRPLLAENIHRNLQEQQKEDADILPVLPFTPNNLQHFSPARPDGLASRELSFGRLSRQMPAPTGPGDTTLASLLQISTKTLQTRERSCLQDIPESPLAMARILPQPSNAGPARPSSSAPRSHAPGGQRPGSVRQAGAGAGAAGSAEAPSRVPSARTRARGRLAPLDRTKTSFLEEETLLRGGLRGRSLQPGGDHLIRSGTLPPLSSSALGSHQSSGASRLGRISSAVAPSADKIVASRGGTVHSQALSLAVASPPSAAVAVTVDNRPSTTHTFRSDTPYGRRSSTPLGLRAGVLLNLGIHGNSIGAGSIVHHHLEEGEEGDATRPAHSSNWGSYPPSHSVNNPYRRGKQLGYIVR